MPDIFNIFPFDKEINGWIKKYKFNSITAPAVYQEKQIKRQKVSKNIIVIGRLDKEDVFMRGKGLSLNMFQTLHQLLIQRNDFNLIVVGDGINKKLYEALFGEHQRVSFLGWKNNFNQQLNSASIVIGGFGLNGVILDTVPYGILPMLSQTGCFDFWKDQENALIFDYRSSESIKEKINDALDNPDKVELMSENAKQSIREYALPIPEAGLKWKLLLEHFINN